MTDVNLTFTISLVIIVIGYLIKKLKIITEENGDVIAKIIFNLTLPAVILKITSTLEFEVSLILLPIVNIIFGLLMAGIGLVYFKSQPNNLKGLLLMAIIGFNVAHFSFPLVEGIWGEHGMQYIALIDAGNAFTVFVLCYFIGSLFSPKNQLENNKVNFKKILKKLVRSAPLLSYIIAMIINFSGLSLPFFIYDFLDIFARANTVLSLLLLGIFLNFKFKKTEWFNILKVLILRYSLGLILGFLLFFLLPSDQFNTLFRMILLISLILPLGLAVIPFSVEFDYDKKLITIIVNFSIIISFILIWILVLILNG